jgi:VWA domain containing CoxE-like protein
VSEASRKTTSRRELAKHDHFEQVSPEVGELDESAFDDAMETDPDAALAMLADLTGATDATLRALAKKLAGRLMLDVAQRGAAHRPGIGKLMRQPYQPDGGDIDFDASFEAIALARATRSLPDTDDLRVTGWQKRTTAYSLLVDRSGSMTGQPLATSAVAAAAMAWRAPHDYSVIAFAADAVVAKGQAAEKDADRVINDVLSLRGFGTTDVALAIRAANEQLAGSRAARKITVLLSDCRSTVPSDMIAAARSSEELVIIAPEGDSAEAEALGRAVGAPVVTVTGPSDVPNALARALDR